MCMQNFIKIFLIVQEVGPVSLFQNFVLSKASTDDKWPLAIPSAWSCQYQCVSKVLSKYPLWFKSNGLFINWSWAVFENASWTRMATIGNTPKVDLDSLRIMQSEQYNCQWACATDLQNYIGFVNVLSHSMSHKLYWRMSPISLPHPSTRRIWLTTFSCFHVCLGKDLRMIIFWSRAQLE